MLERMMWPRSSRSARLKGRWVALDNCRFDPETRQPIEGDLVDSDANLAQLCRRMQELGQSACTILFCEDDVLVQQPRRATLPREAYDER